MSAVRNRDPLPFFSRAAVARVLPFLVYMAFVLLADLLGRAGWAPEQLHWLYPAKIGAVVLALWYFRRDYQELRQGWPGAAAVALALVAGVLVFGLWIALTAPWMRLGSATGYAPLVNGSIDWLLAALRLGGAALVVPLMEELFWRSFLMRWLERPDFAGFDPAHIKWRAFVVTVILFAVEHDLWLSGMVAGAVYGLLYMRTRNLWVPIVAHAVTNGVLGAWIIYTANWRYW